MNENSSKSYSLINFDTFGLIGVLFVALKLTGYISWSWWWVTAPFWGPVALFLVAFLSMMAYVLFGKR